MSPGYPAYQNHTASTSGLSLPASLLINNTTLKVSNLTSTVSSSNLQPADSHNSLLMVLSYLAYFSCDSVIYIEWHIRSHVIWQTETLKPGKSESGFSHLFKKAVLNLGLGNKSDNRQRKLEVCLTWSLDRFHTPLTLSYTCS